MIAFIHGELVRTEVDSVTVRVGGFGLRMAVPSNIIQQIGAVGTAVTAWRRDCSCETTV